MPTSCPNAVTWGDAKAGQLIGFQSTAQSHSKFIALIFRKPLSQACYSPTAHERNILFREK